MCLLSRACVRKEKVQSVGIRGICCCCFACRSAHVVGLVIRLEELGLHFLLPDNNRESLFRLGFSNGSLSPFDELGLLELPSDDDRCRDMSVAAMISSNRTSS